MPAQKTTTENVAFVRGLITEASPLTFPENASIQEENFVLNRDGSRRRRLGMDQEGTGAWVDTGRTELLYSTFAVRTFGWKNVNNDVTQTFGVVQVGYDLWFVDLYQETLSTNLKNGGQPFTFDSSTIGYNISGNARMDFVSVLGQLLVVSEELDKPYLLTYDEDTNTVSFTEVNLKVRDLWGIEDNLDVDDRPETLEDAHKYNLLNQGWKNTRITKDFTIESPAVSNQLLKDKFPNVYNSDGSTKSTASRYYGTYRLGIIGQYGSDGNALYTPGVSTGYPSNADIASLGKASDGSFDVDLINGSFLGTSPAPRGRFIIDAFDRGAERYRHTKIVQEYADREQGNVSCVATFANRVFYSGVDSYIDEPNERSPDYTGTIFFSRHLENLKHLSQCYQEADPTSEEDSALVATDGGVVKITEASKIVRMIARGSSLIVFAENGVWEVSGPDGVFAADDFSISQISNVGCNNPDSIVNAEDIIYYWSDGGIYALVPDQTTGRLQPQNISETTIQTFYLGIPNVARLYATGNYDVGNRRISWLYNDSDDYDGVEFKDKYNKELVWDTTLQAFSVNSIGEAATRSPFIASHITTEEFVTLQVSQPVVHNGEQVQVNGEDVVVTSGERTQSNTVTKYLIVRPPATEGGNYEFSFGLYAEPDFLDWGEVDAQAVMVTGHSIYGDTQRKKYGNYLTVHCARTEDGFESVGDDLEATNQSSCLVQARWDFSNSVNSGKFGTQFQAYRLKRFYVPSGEADPYDYGWEVITTKNRLRGSGKALSLRFQSEAGKDLVLLGWGMEIIGLSNV